VVAGLIVKPIVAQSQDLADLSLKAAPDLVRSGRASPVDLTQACLKRIDRDNPS